MFVRTYSIRLPCAEDFRVFVARARAFAGGQGQVIGASVPPNDRRARRHFTLPAIDHFRYVLVVGTRGAGRYRHGQTHQERCQQYAGSSHGGSSETTDSLVVLLVLLTAGPLVIAVACLR